MRTLLNFIGRKIKGPSYQLSEAIPLSSLVNIGFRRALMLSVGLIRLRKLVFIAPSVTLRNTRFLRVHTGATFQEGVSIDALSTNGVRIGYRTNIGPHTRIQATGVMTNLGTGLTIGSDCGVGAFSFFGCGGGVSIGDNVIMGQYVSFHSENHLFNSLSAPIRLQGVSREGIVVGNDCWIGAKVTFIDGCRVGNGVVVAAGSVVRGVIPDYSVIGGVPARVIKSRY